MKKQKPREYWIVESEYGLDIKRRVISCHKTEEIARRFVKYLNAKDPYDKHVIIKVREVRK